MMALAKTLATLPLDIEQMAYFFASWLAPVVYMTLLAHELSNRLIVQRIALGMKCFYLMMGILSMRKREGARGN